MLFVTGTNAHDPCEALAGSTHLAPPPALAWSAGQTPAVAVNVAQTMPGDVLEYDLPDSFASASAGLKINLAGMPGEGGEWGVWLQEI